LEMSASSAKPLELVISTSASEEKSFPTWS
jgi:hypothetical protein